MDQFLQPVLDSLALLDMVESFDLKFIGGKWLEIKENLVEHALLPKARIQYKSASWKKRYFAARCFAALPQKKDEERICCLVKDANFFVASIAAHAAISIDSFPAIYFLVQEMTRKRDLYAQYFYRDLLLKGSNVLFHYIESLAMQEEDRDMRLVCLDILSAKQFSIQSLALLKSLSSSDDDEQLSAVKVYARNIQKNSQEILLGAIESSKPEMRLEAVYGLSNFSSDESVSALIKRLQDATIEVRLQAARSLKKIGSKGEAALIEEKSRNHPLSYNVVKYVLEFS